MILQKQRTLDEVICSVVESFPNGCNYRLRKDSDGSFWLEYGCYGVLVNLVNGDGRLLHGWFTNPPPEEKQYYMLKGLEGRRIDHVVEPETIRHLLTMEPCATCGGARFAIQDLAQSN